MTEEEQINLAILQSLQGPSGSESFHGSKVITRKRSEIRERVDKHRIRPLIDGTVIQQPTVNQFSDFFKDTIHEFSTPNCICGYLSAANAMLLEEHVAEQLYLGHTITPSSMLEFGRTVLADYDKVLPHVRSNMFSIQSQRHVFWKANGKTEATKHDLMQWVANYEVSNCMKSSSLAASSSRLSSSGAGNTIFVRYNQWPMFSAATKDEACALEEQEKRFGGRLKARGAVEYGEHDSVFFVEEFLPTSPSSSSSGGGAADSVYHTPEEWLAGGAKNKTAASAEGAGAGRGDTETAAAKVPRVVLIDVSGHFVAAVFIPSTTPADGAVRAGTGEGGCGTSLSESGRDPAAGGDFGGDTLIVFNTTVADYISDNLAVAWTFDSLAGRTGQGRELLS